MSILNIHILIVMHLMPHTFTFISIGKILCPYIDTNLVPRVSGQ